MDGVKARILAYCRHADPEESWVADESHLGGPAVRFQATDHSGAPIASCFKFVTVRGSTHGSQEILHDGRKCLRLLAQREMPTPRLALLHNV